MRWILLPAAVLAAACMDGELAVEPTTPTAGDAELSVYIPLPITTVDQLAVEVSAPDMQTVYFNLEIENGAASGTLTIRAGSERRITMTAFDHAGIPTHSGATTIDVVEGSNPAVGLTLEPLGEGDPLEGIVGEYHIVGIVAPPPYDDNWPIDPFWNAYLGHREGMLQLEAEVVDGDGAPLDIPVHWAGAGVNALGQVTAPEWERGWATMITTVTAIVGTKAWQVDVAFQSWGSVEPASALHARGGRTCGIRDDGMLLCWGNHVLAPAHLVEDRTFTGVAVGVAHACALDSDGAIWCWGRGDEGQLGDGNATSSVEPVRVASTETFVDVEVGFAQAHYSCGLTDTGEVWCWGWNQLGQLGDGTFDPSPVPVKTASELEFRSLDLGFAHACALTVDDDAYCWGNNFNGKVGDGTTTNREIPVAVAGGLKFETLATGTQITCGLTAGSDLFCWGGGDETWFPGSLEPMAVEVDPDFVHISVSSGSPHHICGTTALGELYCWGENAQGQLGDGTTTNSSIPVRIFDGTNIREVSTGAVHTCAVTTDDELYCWGGNDLGQLGDLSRDGSLTPVRVADPAP